MFIVQITIIYHQHIFVMYCLRVNVTSPRQIPMHILMSLANKLPCIRVSQYYMWSGPMLDSDSVKPSSIPPVRHGTTWRSGPMLDSDSVIPSCIPPVRHSTTWRSGQMLDSDSNYRSFHQSDTVLRGGQVQCLWEGLEVIAEPSIPIVTNNNRTYLTHWKAFKRAHFSG